MNVLFAISTIILAMATAFALWLWFRSATLSEFRRCADGRMPTIRHEWRQLTRLEQINYIFALQCLRNLPSKFFSERRDVGRYDDFVYVHYENRFESHRAAGLLPWHRWFLALFERSLRSECSYDGPFPYWDWTQDWENPGQSPVLNELYGFGGNGDPRWNSTLVDGWCLQTGPFAKATIPYFAAARGEDSHCLSRKFSAGDTFDGWDLRPESVQQVLQKKTYWDMAQALEAGPHDALHSGIGGDLPTLFSPADPLFYLHHGQIDRLWLIWQKITPAHAKDYGGHSSSSVGRPAEVGDILPAEGLATNITVKDILDVEGSVLCYSYDDYTI
ncbi:hypothetical protein CBER1_11779 [Cercospora berteroae]|uniref:Tyrosinase copper-binding domain-containing protein n=1 Tax=Cercospora berteroae TaxID=357750 RepID=A0A2S6C060_9PEZI|nr:hypothetical protein CBER1_11779 [Cercospora berteroae]